MKLLLKMTINLHGRSGFWIFRLVSMFFWVNRNFVTLWNYWFSTNTLCSTHQHILICLNLSTVAAWLLSAAAASWTRASRNRDISLDKVDLITLCILTLNTEWILLLFFVYFPFPCWLFTFVKIELWTIASKDQTASFTWLVGFCFLCVSFDAFILMIYTAPYGGGRVRLNWGETK